MSIRLNLFKTRDAAGSGLSHTPNSIVNTAWAVLALSLVLALGACASPEEKRERRENAFDLSGGYRTTQAAGSQVEMSFEIANETGRHDIVVKLKRFSPFTQGEREFLAKAGIDAEKVFRTFGSELVLGRGWDDPLDGGENISSNFGESSAFHVCTDQYQYDKETRVAYCLTGTAVKSTRQMEGGLVLSWSRARQVPDKNNPEAPPVTEFTQDQTRLGFVSDMSRAFYKQYLGAWSGACYALGEGLEIESCQSLMIQAREFDNTVFVSAGKGARLTYLGRTFEQDLPASTVSLETLRAPEYPSVHSVFRATDGSGRRILFVGQIWSLGELTGTVVLIDGTTQTELASFRMKKN